MSIRQTHLVTLLSLLAVSLGAAAPGFAQRRSPLTYSFHVGSAHPLGTMDSLNDANIHADLDFHLPLRRSHAREGALEREADRGAQPVYRRAVCDVRASTVA